MCRRPISLALPNPYGARSRPIFSVAPYGQHHTLLSYQCRTVTKDPASRRRFMRHWRLIRPFVRHIVRATLNSVKADAEAAAQLRRK